MKHTWLHIALATLAVASGITLLIVVVDASTADSLRLLAVGVIAAGLAVLIP